MQTKRVREREFAARPQPGVVSVSTMALPLALLFNLYLKFERVEESREMFEKDRETHGV